MRFGVVRKGLMVGVMLVAVAAVGQTTSTTKKKASPQTHAAAKAGTTAKTAAKKGATGQVKASPAVKAHVVGRSRLARTRAGSGSRGASHVAGSGVTATKETGSAESLAMESPVVEPRGAAFMNAKALDPFFSALAAQQAAKLAGEMSAAGDSEAAAPETVRVLQFGDSHTAADIFTGEMRLQMQTRFGDGGLGFQYPGHPFAGYHLAGSTRSQSYGWVTTGNKFQQLGDAELGLGGIAISTSRRGESVTFATTCETLQVEYLRQPRGGRLRFEDNGVFISEIVTGEAGEEESAAGQHGAGTLTYACTAGPHEFTLTTMDDKPVRLLGVVTEQPGVTYECLGINGAVAALMLRWDQKIFDEFLRQRDPQLIVLAYGTNESTGDAGRNGEYVEGLHELLQHLHRASPRAAILMLGPYDREVRSGGRGRRGRWGTSFAVDRIIADQREACRVDGCAFYDEKARMGGSGAMSRWVSRGLAQVDHTHLTGTGYRMLADSLYRDLVGVYNSYLKAQSKGESVTKAAPEPSYAKKR